MGTRNNFSENHQITLKKAVIALNVSREYYA